MTSVLWWGRVLIRGILGFADTQDSRCTYKRSKNVVRHQIRMKKSYKDNSNTLTFLEDIFSSFSWLHNNHTSRILNLIRILPMDFPLENTSPTRKKNSPTNFQPAFFFLVHTVRRYFRFRCESANARDSDINSTSLNNIFGYLHRKSISDSKANFFPRQAWLL